MTNAVGPIKFIAPKLIQSDWNEASVLGSTVWLWMNSDNHNELPLHTLTVALLPAIKRRQFILGVQEDQPVFFLSWAELSVEAEHRYLENHQLRMFPEDWNSGDRFWFIDWVAPFGHTAEIYQILQKDLLRDLYARSLYHRADERGRRIQHFFGSSFLPSERSKLKLSVPTGVINSNPL